MKTTQTFTSIDCHQLSNVIGGAARVASTSKNGDVNQQLQLMLTEIASAIKEVGANKSGGMDQMMPMLMMMMMGGGGGGGGGAVAAPPPPAAPPQAPTYIRVNVNGRSR